MTPARRAAAAVIILCLVPACAPEAVSEQGDGIGSLYNFFAIVAAVIFVVVAGLIAWSILRYRDKDGSGEEPPQVHTNLKLEILWFAIPTVIVAVLFFLSMDRLGAVNDEEADPGVTVSVEGFQWGWRFTYDDGGHDREPAGRAGRAVVLPVDESDRVRCSSRTDVIHSFYIPRLLMKRDVIPGRDESHRRRLRRAGNLRREVRRVLRAAARPDGLLRLGGGRGRVRGVAGRSSVGGGGVDGDG